ncbi:magnesium and cobalt transport protein CorA [Castellaniella defragrans]|uniref:Magnesium transporter n=1 Tax=Castellaniella defragrans TaxID=75697 RepID=A0A7W9TMI0_CASDE|nr:magnesium and cobalt transport protein CorA [Castellaniella defragrans]KAB0594934.1 magnesium and cobalt transport protein CorA [Castellaniella defragrans]MBB6082052.1 magnesium transporter [Castellaniella defragrans]
MNPPTPADEAAARPPSDAGAAAADAADTAGARLEAAFRHAAVASTLYLPGQPDRDVGLAELGTAAAGSGLLWVGLKEPDEALVRDVGRRLGLPGRAIEEIIAPHRRPKIIEYDQLTLVVVVTVEIVQDRPGFGDTQLLIGPGYLLTIRRHAEGSYRELRNQLAEAPEFLSRGSDYVASTLLDLLADRAVEALDHMEGRVENVEHQFLLRGFREMDIRRLYRLRRDLLRMQTAIAPLVEICRRLARVDMRNIGADSRAYFNEVADRIQRIVESIAGLREALAFAFEASMMISQMQQTDITRKLAAWAAILAVPTAVAGIYGMNFNHMPELGWTYGYPAMLAGTGAVCGLLYWKFRRIKWL